nr:hypothetical protein Itr_chr14CG20720 [Ipomoea trifida]
MFSGVSLYKPSGFLLLPIGLVWFVPHPRSRILVSRRGGISGQSLALDESKVAAGPSLSRRPRLPPSSLAGVHRTVEVAVGSSPSHPAGLKGRRSFLRARACILIFTAK